MFSGIQEILVVIAIIAAVFFIPRMTGRSSPQAPAGPRHRAVLSGKMRLALVLSAFWIIATMLVWKPWTGDWLRFAAFGILPVGLLWCIRWIVAGFRRPVP